MNEHAHHEESVGAYLLGALSEIEAKAYERHLEECATCREELERLRPAAEALPRSVTPVAPPPDLKASLMEVVREEARVRDSGPRRAEARERLGGLRQRLAALVPAHARMRPAAAWVSASFLLIAGVVTGFGVASLVSGDRERTVVASVDERRVPFASGSLRIAEDGGAILRVHGMPELGSDKVYEAWVQRNGETIPQSTFGVGPDGSGAAAVPDALEDADAVLVTREPRGGARAPSEKPILRVKL
jgi:anti-sigma-K factor RskA